MGRSDEYPIPLLTSPLKGEERDWQKIYFLAASPCRSGIRAAIIRTLEDAPTGVLNASPPQLQLSLIAICTSLIAISTGNLLYIGWQKFYLAVSMPWAWHDEARGRRSFPWKKRCSRSKRTNR
jgi:hypothetical protein